MPNLRQRSSWVKSCCRVDFPLFRNSLETRFKEIERCFMWYYGKKWYGTQWLNVWLQQFTWPILSRSHWNHGGVKSVCLFEGHSAVHSQGNFVRHWCNHCSLSRICDHVWSSSYSGPALDWQVDSSCPSISCSPVSCPFRWLMSDICHFIKA